MGEPSIQPQAIIIGFGLPGRFVAEVLDARAIAYTIIELNPVNARSASSCGKRVICGDAREVAILEQAGIRQVQVIAVTLPDEKIVIEVLHVARALNPAVRSIARCNYTSTGIKAQKAGATEVIVEEQIVALEFARLLGKVIETG